MPPRQYPPQPPSDPIIVSPRWILSALGVMLALALLCAYITLCGLFYQGQWQIALSPARTVLQTPSIPFTEVHFGTDESGQPQLFGWFLPAANYVPPAPQSIIFSITTLANTLPAPRTALLLHSGVGSIADALPTVTMLHNAGMNVLIFDYRGFGRSGGKHPTQDSMQEDAADALTYLRNNLKLPANADTVLVGEGIGASLAVHLASDQPDIHSLILLNAKGDIDKTLDKEPRAAFVPTGLLFNQPFPLAAPLRSLKTPKLLITTTTGSAPSYFQNASNPKTTLEVPPGAPQQVTLDAIARFLSDSDRK